MAQHLRCVTAECFITPSSFLFFLNSNIAETFDGLWGLEKIDKYSDRRVYNIYSRAAASRDSIINTGGTG
jgi:hypothetical protein